MQSTKGILYIWIINVTCGGQDDRKEHQLLDWAFMIMTAHPPLQQQSQEFIVIIVLMMH